MPDAVVPAQPPHAPLVVMLVSRVRAMLGSHHAIVNGLPGGHVHHSRFFRPLSPECALEAEWWEDWMGRQFSAALFQINGAHVRCACESCRDFCWPSFPSGDPFRMIRPFALYPAPCGCMLVLYLTRLCRVYGVPAPELRYVPLYHIPGMTQPNVDFMSDPMVDVWWNAMPAKGAAEQLAFLRLVWHVMRTGGDSANSPGPPQQPPQGVAEAEESPPMVIERLIARQLSECDSESASGLGSFSAWLLRGHVLGGSGAAEPETETQELQQEEGEEGEGQGLQGQGDTAAGQVRASDPFAVPSQCPLLSALCPVCAQPPLLSLAFEPCTPLAAEADDYVGGVLAHALAHCLGRSSSW
jgi:hypothetical protein